MIFLASGSDLTSITFHGFFYWTCWVCGFDPSHTISQRKGCAHWILDSMSFLYRFVAMGPPSTIIMWGEPAHVCWSAMRQTPYKCSCCAFISILNFMVAGSGYYPPTILKTIITFPRSRSLSCFFFILSSFCSLVNLFASFLLKCP